MLGDLIAHLDRPDVAAAVLTTLDPIVANRIERRAAAAAMAVADFTAGAVRDFVERADDGMTNAGSNCSPQCARRKIQASPRSRRSWDGSLLTRSVLMASDLSLSDYGRCQRASVHWRDRCRLAKYLKFNGKDN